MGANKKPRDITGQRFGTLTAIKRVGSSKNNTSIWLFKCDCGVEKEILLSNILRGTTKSCGCIKTLKDITGQRFGRLTAIERVGHNSCGKVTWLFRCDCGVEKVISCNSVVSGIKSCGCLKKGSKNGQTHGCTHTRLYRIWGSMKSRCYDANTQNYLNYGARGIIVCDEWQNFVSFQTWALQNGYQDNLSIDRINPNGNYEEINCRWATNIEQARNKTNTIWYSIDGIKKPLIEWCKILNISFKAVRTRRHDGNSPFYNKYNEVRAYVCEDGIFTAEEISAEI